MQAQTSHLPFKVNMAGVIPAIFASTFLLFPASLSTWFGQSESFGFLQSFSLALNPGQPLYILVFAGLIISFCFIWLALTFNTREVSDNLKRSGAYIAGIRPGEQTCELYRLCSCKTYCIWSNIFNTYLFVATCTY